MFCTPTHRNDTSQVKEGGGGGGPNARVKQTNKTRMGAAKTVLSQASLVDGR